MKTDSIQIKKHGVTVVFSRGENIGVTLMTKDQAMNVQMDYHELEEIAAWAREGSTELERRKEVINSTTERNEELRLLVNDFIKVCESILENYDKSQDIEVVKFLEIRGLCGRAKHMIE